VIRYRQQLLAVFFLISCVDGSTQQNQWTFESFHAAVVALRLRETPGSPANNSLAATSNSIVALRSRYIDKYGADADSPEAISKHLSAGYIASMAEDLAVLQNLPNKPSERIATLNDISNDLTVKVAFRPAILGTAATEFVSSVKVQVILSTPKDQSIDTASLSIRYNSCAFGFTPPGTVLGNGRGPFPPHTMPPGCFTIWAQSGEEKVWTIPRQDVGKDAGTTELIHIF
jgi:hypothetical protein